MNTDILITMMTQRTTQICGIYHDALLSTTACRIYLSFAKFKMSSRPKKLKLNIWVTFCCMSLYEAKYQIHRSVILHRHLFARRRYWKVNIILYVFPKVAERNGEVYVQLLFIFPFDISHVHSICNLVFGLQRPETDRLFRAYISKHKIKKSNCKKKLI